MAILAENTLKYTGAKKVYQIVFTGETSSLVTIIFNDKKYTMLKNKYYLFLEELLSNNAIL